MRLDIPVNEALLMYVGECLSKLRTPCRLLFGGKIDIPLHLLVDDAAKRSVLGQLEHNLRHRMGYGIAGMAPAVKADHMTASVQVNIMAQRLRQSSVRCVTCALTFSAL